MEALSTLATHGVIKQAQHRIAVNNTKEALDLLLPLYAASPSDDPLLIPTLKDALRQSILLSNPGSMLHMMDKFGLASLHVDLEEYEEALPLLSELIDTELAPRVEALHFRAVAATCSWAVNPEAHVEAAIRLARSAKQAVQHPGKVLNVPPFEALRLFSLSARDAANIATFVSEENAQGAPSLRRPNRGSFPLRIGYLSPDFSKPNHPLPFLMQAVFMNHDTSRYNISLYSIAELSGSPTAPWKNIMESDFRIKHLSPSLSPKEIVDEIVLDDLDVLVDLCGHAGSTLISKICSYRPARSLISYMGFPGASPSPYLDFQVVDEHVAPPHLEYVYGSTKLLKMPNSYFVASHALMTENDLQKHHVSRADYCLPEHAFVFCCHNRADKIDPATFMTWCEAMRDDPAGTSVLWLLKSGDLMEEQLKSLAMKEYSIGPERFVFASIAPPTEHLSRLSLADLFLDTPAYNSHTVGCDALAAGVPMVTLLKKRATIDITGNVQSIVKNYFEQGPDTEKLSSRVGASLLRSCGCEELIASSLHEYKTIMLKCSARKNDDQYSLLRRKLQSGWQSCALFDAKQWVEDFERKCLDIAANYQHEPQHTTRTKTQY